jgi:sulfate transport system substrate-binding protein
VVEKKGTRQVAEDYLKFLYTDAGQRIIGKHHYRPIEERVLAEFSRELPPIKLFTIERVAKDWNAAQAKFFDQGAIFDQIFAQRQ